MLACAKVTKAAYKDLKKCTEEDIRTLMYEYFCCNGDMKKLESYKGIHKVHHIRLGIWMEAGNSELGVTLCHLTWATVSHAVVEPEDVMHH